MGMWNITQRKERDKKKEDCSPPPPRPRKKINHTSSRTHTHRKRHFLPCRAVPAMRCDAMQKTRLLSSLQRHKKENSLIKQTSNKHRCRAPWARTVFLRLKQKK